MLEKKFHSNHKVESKLKFSFSVVLCLIYLCSEAYCCSPGRSGARRRSTRKLTPLVFKQHVPNVPENSFGASGPPEGRIYRDDDRFRNLVPNYNVDIVFKDEEGTGVDRLMTRRCKERLDILAISVMNMWPGVRLRVTEGFDEDGHHPKNSLHYEGRAVAISTSDRDTSKYGMLARLAVDAGFDWVYYESRTHIYCSVKTESTVPSRFSGCFHGSSTVLTKLGTKLLSEVEVGEEILSSWNKHSLSFSKVIGFLHKDPYYTTNFIKIHTESNSTLLLTRDHLLVQGDTSVRAEELNVGDFVIAATRDESVKKEPVNSLTYVNLTGVYAPLTEVGTVFIDGVLCSCYAVVDNHDLAHLAFLPLRLIYVIEDKMPHFMQQAIHLGLEWVRSLLALPSNNTRDSIKGSSQIHWYAQLLCEVGELFEIDCL